MSNALQWVKLPHFFPRDMLQRYLDWLARAHGGVDARGLAPRELALDDIYVPLVFRLDDEAGGLETRDSAHLPEAGEEAEPLAEWLPRERQEPPPVNGLPLAALWERGEQWVILGAPGSGKTTLLGYLALTQARALRDSGQGELPLPINLARFARAWQTHPDWPVSEALFSYLLEHRLGELGFDTEEQRASLLGSFKIALASHNALLLFDAFDNISLPQRQAVSEAVDALLRRYPGNRCLLTSQAIHDPASLFSRTFHFALIEPFTPAQAHRFFQQWMFALEKHEDLVVDETTRAQAERKAEALWTLIDARPGMCQQVSNPLLCTLVALVYCQAGGLPDQQIQLYKLCVDQLILAQTARRHSADDSGPDQDQIQESLEVLALALHRQPDRQRINSAELRSLLADWLQNEQSQPPEQASQRAGQLAERLEAGLLARDGGALSTSTSSHLSKGADEYGFLHLTFQEYLAARRLARQPEALRELLQTRLFDAHWRGVIRLAAAHQGMKSESEGDEFLSAVQSRPHPRDPLLHYTFRLAFLCMRTGRASFHTEDRMFQQWVRLYLAEPVLQPALNRLLRQTGSGLRYQPRSLQPLLEGLGHSDERIRSKAAEALGYLDDSAAVPGLLRVFRHDPQPLARARAAEALGNLHAGEAVEALLAALREDSAFFVRRQAALALAKFPEVLPALLAALDDAEAATRWRAAEALGNLKHPAAVPALRRVLREDRVAGVRWRAAEALGALGGALEDLLYAVKNDPDTTVRSRAAEALGHYKPMEALNALLDALRRDAFPAVRWRAAESLGRLKDTLALPALLLALQRDPDSAVRWSAAQSLGSLKNTQAVPALLETLENDLDPTVRWSAAESLGHLRDARAIPVLTRALADRYAAVRGKACQALGYLKDHGVTNELLRSLARDPHPTVRRQAAEALGYLGDRAATPALLAALSEDDDANVRWCAADALGHLKDPLAVEGLAQALGNEPEMSVRWRVAQALELIDLGCLL